MSDFPLHQNMGDNVVPSNSLPFLSLVGEDESGKKVVDQPSAMEETDHHPSSPCSDAEHTDAFQQLDDKDDTNRASCSSLVGPSFQANRPVRGSSTVSHSSSTTNQRSGSYVQSGPVNHRPNYRPWKDNNRYMSQGNAGRNGGFRASNAVVTCGPRSNFGTNVSAKPKTEAEKTARPDFYRSNYNSQDFQTEYDDAKFYIIKPCNEDDVHKAIKYNVWSSTPYGNRKLEANFAKTEAKTWETGKPFPIFLFFSVNTSGQFVGVAEMVAPVDFAKDLDFWQNEKWASFFPIQWHIIKDVPYAQFQHIILENNEGRPVTFTRDAHEIELHQGLEMLRIFKNYAERTSILDDFTFYEQREKSQAAKRRGAKLASRANSYK